MTGKVGAQSTRMANELQKTDASSLRQEKRRKERKEKENEPERVEIRNIHRVSRN